MGDAKRLAEELKETREELDELQTQLDQQLEDHNQEMEEFEENLKKQYADEIRTRDETIGQLEQQVTDTNTYWQEAYDKLQAEKDQMYTDYESKLATWEKKRGSNGWIWENPITGETANEDKTWKNPREIALDEKMAVMQDKMDRMTAKSRKGGVQTQEKQELINRLKVELKDERAAHLAIQEAKTLVDIQWAYEVDRLEGVLTRLNEKAENFKMAFQEEETRRISAIQAADIRVKRVTIEAEEARKEHQRQTQFSQIRQMALERELRRQVRQRNTSGLYQAELEMKLFLFDEVKQKEFDVLRTKLRKARETHQDDLESLSILWPPAEDGYLLPTILKPFTDVIRVEQDRKRLLERTKKKGLLVPEGEESDTDSDDEEAHVARREMQKELTMYREEALMPSLRVLDPEERPRFKAVSMTPRRRRYVLYDTPRLYQPPRDEEEEQEEQKHNNKKTKRVKEVYDSDDGDSEDNLMDEEEEIAEEKEEETVNNYDLPEFKLSARSDASSIKSETSSQAIAAAVRLRLQLPPALAQHRPATMLAAIATRDYGAEPWDSDDDTARNDEFDAAERKKRRQAYIDKHVIKKQNASSDSKTAKIQKSSKKPKSKIVAVGGEKPNKKESNSASENNLKETESHADPKIQKLINPVNPEVQQWFGEFLDHFESKVCKQSITVQKVEMSNLMNVIIERVEFQGLIRDLVKEIGDLACDVAPSTIAFNKEREKARQLKLDKIRNPWKSEKSRALVGVPKIFSRALRSMLRNGTITKPRARQLALLYSKAPTLEEEDEAAGDGNVTERSIYSLVGEAIKLAEEDEPDADFLGDETEQGQADTRGRNESIRLLRQESELVEAIDMMHEQERHILLKRRFMLDNHIAIEDNRIGMVDADMHDRNLVKKSKENNCSNLMEIIHEEQSIMNEKDLLKLETNKAKREDSWVPCCTGIIPLPLDFKPNNIVHKIRIKTRKVMVKEMQDRVDDEGNTTQVEVEVEKDEEYEEHYTEELSREDSIKREANFLIYDRIASFTTKKYRTVKYKETNDEGEEIQREKQEEYEASDFTKPLKVVIKHWEVHECDPVYDQIPREAIHFEMVTDTETNEVLKKLTEKFDGEYKINREKLGPGFQTLTAKERFTRQQDHRRAELQYRRSIVDLEQHKLEILKEMKSNAIEAKGVIVDKLKFYSNEIDALKNRRTQFTRMQQIEKNLIEWIAKAVGRSKQTKEELVLLAKNAENKVLKARKKLDMAGNPLEEAAMEQNLEKTCKESDRVLRYVRRRFVSEMDTRRRLAEERREVIRQQCSRYQVVLAIGDERMPEVLSIMKDHIVELSLLHKMHSAAIKSSMATETKPSTGPKNAALKKKKVNVFKRYEDACGDLPASVSVAAELLNEIFISSINVPLLDNTSITAKKIKQKKGDKHNRFYKTKGQNEKIAAMRTGKRKREIGLLQEALDTLDGYAGQWLADNEVQQIEGQLALTKTTLDEVQKTATKEKKEADSKIKDIENRLYHAKLQIEATKAMFEKEIAALHKSSGLSIRFLKDAVMATKDAMETLRKEKDAEIMRMAEAHAKQISEMKARMDHLEKIADRRRKWVEALQVQIGRMRAEAARLAELRRKQHEAWERERDGLTKQLEFHIAQSERRLQWIESLKREIALKETEKLRVLKQMEEAKIEHAAIERKLRWQIWQRDETGRQIRMNVDFAFSFFVETISGLAGISQKHNDAIAKNGGIGVLAAMIHRDCRRNDLKPLAARAIAQIAWNGHVDHRVISRRSRDGWEKWMGKVSSEEKWRFDLGYENRVNIIKQEKLAVQAFRANKSEAYSIANRTVRLLKAAYVASMSAKTRAARDAEVLRSGMTIQGNATPSYRHEAPDGSGTIVKTEKEIIINTGPHNENQHAIGQTYGALESLVVLCNEEDPVLQRYATDAIAVLALEVKNRAKFEQVQQVWPALIECLDFERTAEVQRNAAAAIGNLAFENRSHQNQFGDVGAVEALVSLCVEDSTDIDVLENAAAALGNLARSHESNALRIGICGGIETMVRVMNSPKTSVGSDHDGIRVQANAAEALVNCTRNDSHENAERIRQAGIKPLVLLCTSRNLSVQRSAALILGNIAQNDRNRIEIGSKGGIDALFILASRDDDVTKTNAAWALGNLAWAASNQERIGFHMPKLLQLLTSKSVDVRSNAMICVANALFYNESNRRRVAFENEDGLDLLIELLHDASTTVQQHAARALGSAAYNDNVAKLAGERGAILSLVQLCGSSEPQCQRYAAFALGNLALFDPNKRKILDDGGVEALTGMMGSESHQARDLASDCLETLADLADQEQMQMAKDKFGVGGTIDLLKGDNDLVNGMAADTLNEMVWKGGKKEQDDVLHAGGLQALHKLINRDSTSDVTRLKSMWALRTIIVNNNMAKNLASSDGLIETLLTTVKTTSKPNQKQSPKAQEIQEAALGILAITIIEHEKNCRRVLRTGLDTLIHLAEVTLPKQPGMKVLDEGEEVKPWHMLSTGNSNIALDLLQMIGPHNWILCSNCGTRNDGGTRCFHCAHKISFVL